MTTAIKDKDVTDFLTPYSQQVRNLALAARSFVFKMFPEVSEQVDTKARMIGYGYGPKYADAVCMLMPTKAGVNLGIAYAMELSDPARLLQGTGKLHRHVKLRSNADLERPALKSLLKAAVARREKIALKPKKQKSRARNEVTREVGPNMSR